LSVKSQAGKDRNSQTWEFNKTGNYGMVQAKMLLHLPTVLFKRCYLSKIFYVQECVKITKKVRLKTQLMAKMQNLYRIIFSAVNVNFTTELHNNTITK
jgi:hypothetical protein